MSTHICLVCASTHIHIYIYIYHILNHIYIYLCMCMFVFVFVFFFAIAIIRQDILSPEIKFKHVFQYLNFVVWQV